MTTTNKLLEAIDSDKFHIVLDLLGNHYGDNNVSYEVSDKMLKRFAAKKAHIFKLFGEKLKIEKEIDTTIPIRDAQERLEEMVNELMSISPKFFFLCSLLIRGLSIEEVMDNETRVPHQKYRQYANVDVPSRTKISRFAAQFCPKELVDKFQTAYSMFLQDVRAKGKIVVSMDPIDYITMSSNASNWSSCHRLNGGEYRTGPLSYLMDDCTIVTYVQSSKPLILLNGSDEIQCTNKSWRQLAMISPNNNFAIQERQYPNTNKNNSLAVQEIISEILSEANDTEFQAINLPSERVERLHVDFCESQGIHSLHYNDITNRMVGHCDVIYPKFVSDLEEWVNIEPIPKKGSQVFCLDCGNEISDCETLYCYSCDNECHDDDDDYY